MEAIVITIIVLVGIADAIFKRSDEAMKRL